MPNFVPYLALVLISIALLALSWCRTKDKKLIPFYLASSGLIFLFEYVVFVLFEAYVYLPGVFKDQYFDNVLGSNISNGFIVPATGVIIAVFDLGFLWVALITLSFLGIEWLFLHLDIYRQFWWKTIYTGIGLPLQFYVGKWVWQRIRDCGNGFILRLLILYFACVSSQGTYLFYYAAIFRLFFYRVGWFNEPSRDHFAFITLYIFIVSFFFGLAAVLKTKWFWNTFLIVGLYLTHFLLYKLNILEIKGIWVIGLLTLSEAVMLFVLKYMNKVLVQKN